MISNFATLLRIEQLCKAAMGEGGAEDLAHLLLGGNDTTEAGRAAQTEALRKACPDLKVDWMPR